MTKTHFSNLILAAVFSTAMAAPAIALASASVPVKAGSTARSAHGTLVAAITSDDKKDDKKSEKKDKADKGSKKDKAPAPTGGGW